MSGETRKETSLPEQPSAQPQSLADQPDLELVVPPDVVKTSSTECHPKVDEGITDEVAESSDDVESKDTSGLHLLYEGIQKQLSKTPTKDDKGGALDEATGQFVVKGKI